MPWHPMKNSHIKVCFDCDGTLLDALEDFPRHEIIDAFRIFERLGCDMYVWSGNGTDYAERWAYKLGLKAKVVPKWSFKPDIVFDDFPSDVPWDKPNAKVNFKV
jgi:hypothetical protein